MRLIADAYFKAWGSGEVPCSLSAPEPAHVRVMAYVTIEYAIRLRLAATRVVLCMPSVRATRKIAWNFSDPSTESTGKGATRHGYYKEYLIWYLREHACLRGLLSMNKT